MKRHFLGTEAGLTPLYGAVGSLIAALDKIFVNGYNSQSLTSITRVVQVATVTKAAHAFRSGQLINQAGWDQAEYNGDFVISNVTTNTYDITVTGSPVTPGTGVATGKVASVAGWAIAFTGTNLRVYRAGSGNRHYYRVDDTGTTVARVVAYEAMTDVNTGTNPFPTAAQFAGGLYWPKSTTADSVNARPFAVIADEVFAAFVMDTDSTNGLAQPVLFGEAKTYKAADVYHSILIAGATATPNTSSTFSAQGSLATAQTAHFKARSYTQVGGSVTLGKHIDSFKSNAGGTLGGVGQTYPHPVDGGLWISPIWLSESVAALVVGHVPGIWAPLHNRPIVHGDYYDGVGPLAGKRFYVTNIYNTGQLHLEVSDTW